MNEASVYLLKQNNGTKEIFSNNFFLSTFESYHPLRENDPSKLPMYHPSFYSQLISLWVKSVPFI